ncbi:MAG: IPT/TIG domain-containing protein [Candidatus Acidiferrales bacterium]
MPTLSGLNPNSASAGGAALTVTASGTGFVSASMIEWNGTALGTTYASSTSLTAQIPSSDLSSTGTASVTVQNPAPGGGTSSAVTFTISAPPNPTPTATSISPSSGTVGGAAFMLTVTGTQFISSSQVLWNGSPATTTYVSSTSLTAQIPASDLSSAGMATVAVQNPTPGGGTSGNLTFTINAPGTNLTVLDLEGTDLIWNPSAQKIYVAVPSTASANANTITVVDPVAGAITGAQQLDVAASGLAISDDSGYLYAVTNGGAMVRRFTLPAITSDISWSLGTDSSSGTPYLAGDIKVQPGAPHTLAVPFGDYGAGEIAVFDDAVERSGLAGTGADAVGDSLQWKQDGSELYAAYATGNDSPYFTSGGGALYVMPVNSSGVGTVTTYPSSFRGDGVHLESDPATGYVYDDSGEVFNAANGIPVGNYRWSRSNLTIFPGPLSVVDPSLHRYYTLLEVNQSDQSLAFQVQVFDQTNFQLLHTIVIPNPVGEPTNFIRWGQSGLAFVTGSSSGTAGKLYILDGSFVNPSGVLDTSAGSGINPVPTVTAISPLTATVGSQSVTLTLTVTGRDFIGQPTVFWNGTALVTSMLDSTELTAQIPASDLATVSQAAITASNGGTPLSASTAMAFSVNAAPPSGTQISVYGAGGNDLVWDGIADKIYVSMPGVQGDSGDAIGIIDPIAGTVSSSGFIGSDPAAISLSGDGQLLYVGLYGQNAIQQLKVPGFTANATWNLGGAGTFFGPSYALDLQVAPGAPQTTAVTLASFGVSPSSAAVVIYDGFTPRSTPLESSRYDYSGLKWGVSASTLYAVDQSIPQTFLVLGVGSSGAALDQHYDGVFDTYSPGIHFDAGTGLVYTDAGQAIQPSDGTIAGSYGASGISVPDSTLNRVFILGQTSPQVGTPNYTIESFDQTHFTSVGSITIQNVVGTPTSFIRWGTNGLAFTTRVGEPYDFQGSGPGLLYVISGTFVKPAAVAGPSFATAQLLPVKRTWGLGTGLSQQSRSIVVHPNH